MAPQITQIGLVSGILTLLDEQQPGITLTARQYNTINQAADQILAALQYEEKRATANMGYDAWLETDDVGRSSKFMANYLLNNRYSNADYADAHPKDPADLGRCRTLLAAVPELAPELPKMAEVSEVWANLIEHWDELCALMDDEAPRWREGDGSAIITYNRMKELGC